MTMPIDALGDLVDRLPEMSTLERINSAPDALVMVYQAIADLDRRLKAMEGGTDVQGR